jgi:phosphatidylinositol alpha-1,6-mannosyltransferase
VNRFHCHVNVVTSHTTNDESFDAQFSGNGMNIIRSGERLLDWKYQRFPEFLKKYWYLNQQILKCAPGTVHCGDLFPQALSGYLLQKKYGLPYLVYVHGDEMSQTENRRLQPLIRNQIYKKADVLIAANQFSYDRILKITEREENLYLLTPGVDMQEFFPGVVTKEIVDARHLLPGPVILTVARLVPRKGHEMVLRSIKPLLKHFPDMQYLIVGDGPGRAQLESIVKCLDMQRNVQFVGNVAHQQLGDYYRAADVFVMTNKTEPGGDIESFGMVFIEAGACGKPVIGGKSGGTSEAIVHGVTGFLCTPEDQAQVTRAIEMLLRNPELAKKMGMAGYQRAVDKFDWESRAERLYEIDMSLHGYRTYRQ